MERHISISFLLLIKMSLAMPTRCKTRVDWRNAVITMTYFARSLYIPNCNLGWPSKGIRPDFSGFRVPKKTTDITLILYVKKLCWLHWMPNFRRFSTLPFYFLPSWHPSVIGLNLFHLLSFYNHTNFKLWAEIQNAPQSKQFVRVHAINARCRMK
jgi:hypothetical protein